MKKILSIKLIAILLLVATTSEIFSQFIISGEFRPRAEYRDGYKKLNSMTDAPAFFISQRTRLNLGFKSDRFKTLISLQDVRTWGSQKQLVANEANGMSIHEAWGEAFFGKSNLMSMKFGRQEIILDDHRMFGSVGWAQQARSHDALVFKYNKPSTIVAHLGIAYNQNMGALTNSSYTVPKSYKTMQYLWLNKKLMNDKLSISILALNKGDEVRVDKNLDGKFTQGEYWDNYTQTLGTHTTLKVDSLGKFKIGLNAYYQMGSMAEYNGTNTAPRNLSAYLIGLDLSYKATDKISLALGYELQSGNSQTDTTGAYAKTNHAFTPFFGTNHKFNGHMDYFYVGNHGNNVGLQDIYLKAKFNNMKGKKAKFYFGGDFHVFLSAADIYDVNQDVANPIDLTKAASPFLGAEMDLYVGFPITKGVNFKFGHSTMFGMESMETLKGGDRKQFNNWSYMQVVIKPTFFDSSKYALKKVK